MTELRNARVAGVGSALPSRLVPNTWFESFLDTTDAWISDRTGIRARHFAGEGESTATLAADAARRALEAADLAPESIDLIVVCTLTPDRPMPAAAAYVQTSLGVSCPAFDMNAACAGFVYGVSIGTAQVQAGAAERVLVIGAETLSRVLDMSDRTTCVLFGDGAGAIVIEPADEPGIFGSVLELDGRQSELLTIPGGGSVEPLTPEGLDQRRNTIRMSSGQAVFKRAVTGMADACGQLLDKAGLSASDVALVIPHQANRRIMVSVAQRVGVPLERVFMDVEEVGNTSAASIPIAMDHAWRAGRLSPGDLVLTTAFGAGLAWGANLIRWTAPAPGAAG